MSSAANFRELFGNLPPEPKFDRLAVRDTGLFDSVPRVPPRPLGLDSFSMFGFPVIVDDEVEVGVIELRKGEEVVERVRI